MNTLVDICIKNCIPNINQTLYIEHKIFFSPISAAFTFKYCHKYKPLDFYYIYEDEMEDNELYYNIFAKIIKTKNAFIKLWTQWKYKYSPVIIDTDLCLSKLDKNNKNTISIMKSNKVYLFSIFDLKKIIYNSLNNNNFLFSEPILIKNPYDNQPFAPHDLYNIYFFMKFRNIEINELFYYYFKFNFNIYMFKNKCTDVLRDHVIENLTQSENINVVSSEITGMIEYYNYYASQSRKIYIADGFPLQILINALRPMLRIYFKSMFGLNESHTGFYIKEFFNVMFFFQKRNPKFGRKYYNCDFKNNIFQSGSFYHIDFKPFDFIFTSDYMLIDVLSIFDKERKLETEMDNSNTLNNANTENTENISMQLIIL